MVRTVLERLRLGIQNSYPAAVSGGRHFYLTHG